MSLWKNVFVSFLFLIYSLTALADPLWVTTPIQYKRHYEVQTFLFEGVSGPFGALGYYATYIFDQRYPNTPRHVAYMVFSGVESHARMAHEQAVTWLINYHAHLRVVVPENHEYIGVDAPRPPSAPRSGRRPYAIPDPVLPDPAPMARSYTVQNNQTGSLHLRIRSEPTSKRSRSEAELDTVEEESIDDLKRDLMFDRGSMQ